MRGARTPETARFISAPNSAQVKRNLLASFTDVLLIPVTIVPRAVGAVLTTAAGGMSAMAGPTMLQPQWWSGAQAQGHMRLKFDPKDEDDELEQRSCICLLLTLAFWSDTQYSHFQRTPTQSQPPS